MGKRQDADVSDFGPLGVRYLINGRRFPMRGLHQATLAELITIKSQTGLGVGELERRLERSSEVGYLAVLDDAELMEAFAVQVWLARHPYDAALSVMGAVSDFGLSDLEIEVDPKLKPGDAEESEPDPT